MPIYEYLCDDCGTKFEKLVRRADQVLCPQCGEKHLTQQYSTFAARANGHSDAPMLSPQASSRVNEMGGGCGGGMCQSPGLCGRN